MLAGGERIDEEATWSRRQCSRVWRTTRCSRARRSSAPYVALPIRQLDEAIERANAVEFGLSASIFTNSLQATQEFVKRLEAGMLHVNSQTAGADVHVPFGGIKASGFGPHEQGPRRSSSTRRSSRSIRTYDRTNAS